MLQVMIVDMLEGFTRIGPLATPRVDALVPRQAEFLAALPERSRAIFLADEHQRDDAELRRFPPHCMKGTREAELRTELLGACRHSNTDVTVVRKRNFSGFVETDLERIVAAAPARSWIVIGCVTDCCIEATVADLVYRGYEVTVVRGLIDTWDLTERQARELGLTPAHAHPAEAINAHWFSHRFPAVWGVRVAERWTELIGESA